MLSINDENLPICNAGLEPHDEFAGRLENCHCCYLSLLSMLCLIERLRSTSATNADSEIYDVVLCLVAGVLKR